MSPPDLSDAMDIDDQEEDRGGDEHEPRVTPHNYRSSATTGSEPNSRNNSRRSPAKSTSRSKSQVEIIISNDSPPSSPPPAADDDDADVCLFNSLDDEDEDTLDHEGNAFVPDVVVKQEKEDLDYNMGDDDDEDEELIANDDLIRDPDFSGDEELDTSFPGDDDAVTGRRHEYDIEIITRIPLSSLPEGTDLDPVIEITHIEDQIDSEGNEQRVWHCKPCSIRFKYYQSFSKHREREHPSKDWPLEFWEREPYDPVAKLDRRTRVPKYFDEDSDFDYEDEVRGTRRRGRGRPKGRKNKKSNSAAKINGNPLKNRLTAGETAGRKRSRKRKKRDDEEEDDFIGRPPPPPPEVPTKCTECDKELKSKRTMISHRNRNHFLPFKCGTCDSAFDSFIKYSVHAQSEHEVSVSLDRQVMVSLSDAGESEEEDSRLPLEEIKERLFPCDHCPKHYVSEVSLSGHQLRRHADEIPDLAVIETYRRLWRTRFDSEVISKHESTLEELSDKGLEARDFSTAAFVRMMTGTTGVGGEDISDELLSKLAEKDPSLLSSKRRGPVVFARSKKTLEQLELSHAARCLRRKKRLLQKQGKNVTDADIVIKNRAPRKTIAEKLATHMAKLERRRQKERLKRISVRKETLGEDAIDEDGYLVKQVEESCIDPETGEIIAAGNGGNSYKKKKVRQAVTDPYPAKYGGVKDTCKLCNEEFENDRLTVMHLKEKHSTYTQEDKEREAAIMAELMPEEANRSYDKPVPGQEGSKYEKKHVCVTCKHAFMHPYKLAGHMEDVHGDKLVIDGTEVSRICPEELKRTEEQLIICQLCGKSIRRRSIRLHVLRRHAGEPFRKSFPCDQCDKSYPVAHQLFWHRRKAHQGTVLFTCELCGREFVCPRTFKVHMRVHDGFMYACKHCGEKFKSQQGCANHEKRHTSTMDFECRFCAKRFWWARDQRKHERIRHSDGIVDDAAIAENRAKDWESISATNCKKMRYLSDSPRDPSKVKNRGRPRKYNYETVDPNEEPPIVLSIDAVAPVATTALSSATMTTTAAITGADSNTNDSEYIPPTGHMTRAQSSAAQAAKEAVITTKPKRKRGSATTTTRKTAAQRKKEQQEAEQRLAIESLDLDGLEEQVVEYSAVDHLTSVSGSHGLAMHHVHQQQQQQQQQIHTLGLHHAPITPIAPHMHHHQQQQPQHQSHGNGNQQQQPSLGQHGHTSYSVLHAMQSAVSHSMAQNQQMFLTSCMQQQQQQQAIQYQVPPIPGDCKLCRLRTSDLRSHYSEVHKVLPDVLQHFL